jgi:hypothetical protein
MSSIFAFAKSRLSPVGSANSAGKPCLLARRIPSCYVDILTHKAFDPLASSPTSAKWANHPLLSSFFSFLQNSANHSTPIGAGLVERFSPIHF